LPIADCRLLSAESYLLVVNDLPASAPWCCHTLAEPVPRFNCELGHLDKSELQERFIVFIWLVCSDTRLSAPITRVLSAPSIRQQIAVCMELDAVF
jgi:hypothetical protein